MLSTQCVYDSRVRSSNRNRTPSASYRQASAHPLIRRLRHSRRTDCDPSDHFYSRDTPSVNCPVNKIYTDSTARPGQSPWMSLPSPGNRKVWDFGTFDERRAEDATFSTALSKCGSDFPGLGALIRLNRLPRDFLARPGVFFLRVAREKTPENCRNRIVC